MSATNLRSTLLAATTILALVPLHLQAEEATAAVVFKGTSTLHGFEGTVASQPFEIELHEDPATGLMHVSAAATVNVDEMTTDNRKRDSNMFKMLDAATFARIEGRLVDAVLPAEGTAEATLLLTIRGVAQPVAATLSDWHHEEGQVSCRMTFPVSLKAFGLKAPSVIGLIRVGDTVDVECTIRTIRQ